MPSGPIRFGEVAVIPDEFIIKNCGPYAIVQLGILIDWLRDRGARFQTAANRASEWRARLASGNRSSAKPLVGRHELSTDSSVHSI